MLQMMLKKNKNNRLNLLRSFLFVLLFCISCSTNSDKRNIDFFGEWNEAALQHTVIKFMEKDEEGLFVGSNTGLYYCINYTEEYINLGLKEKEIRGVVRFSDGELLAGTKAFDFSSGDTTLYLLKPGMEKWEPFMNNFGGENGEYTYISKGPFKRTGASDTIWVRVGNAVARSKDKGNSWELVSGSWNNWGGAAVLFYFDPYREDNIWVGGVSALSQANLYKTTDNGKNWSSKTSGLSDNIEAVAYDVITHSTNKEMVLVGLSGAIQKAFKIKKSTNGGENWETVLSDIGVHSFTRSTRDENIIYASGINQNGTLFFTATNNFGDSWQTVEFEDGPTQIRVNDMISVLQNGKEVLYFGTNKGLYLYTLEN